jgi:hypothetical protein
MNSSSGAVQSSNLLLLSKSKFLATFGMLFDFSKPFLCVAVSAFGRLVSHVVGMCPKKQMIRVCAFRVVALVKHVHAIWNRAEMQHPRHSTSRLFFRHAAKADHSVALGFGSKPQPAPVRFLNLQPKSLFKRRCHIRMWLLQAPHCNKGA